jgi:tetrahydromethanopterin S-methyltransferase subunit H
MNQIVAESNEAMAKEIDWFVALSDYPFLRITCRAGY